MIRIHLEPMIVAHELIFLSCNRIMPPKKHNQPTSNISILQIDAAMFQAAVTSAVAAVMAHLNANNTNVSGNTIDNPDRGNDQVQQRVPICKDTSNLKPNTLKRKFENKKGSCSTQEPNRGQRTGAVNTPIRPVIPTNHAVLRKPPTLHQVQLPSSWRLSRAALQ